MNWYKKSQEINKPPILWHISNEKFKAFDTNKTAQGIVWFAKDRNDLLNNLHGASINNQKPIYLYECLVNMKKVAGWNEYEKYGLSQLESMGYDSIDLDDDVAVLDVNNIIISSVERIK